jgi:hypothetical protein
MALDSSLSTALVTGGGVCGVVVLLLIVKVLVPGWYATKLEQENQVLSGTAERAVNELAIANQLIGELRAIAIARGGPQIAEHFKRGGAAVEAPAVAQET